MCIASDDDGSQGAASDDGFDTILVAAADIRIDVSASVSASAFASAFADVDWSGIQPPTFGAMSAALIGAGIPPLIVTGGAADLGPLADILLLHDDPLQQHATA